MIKLNFYFLDYDEDELGVDVELTGQSARLHLKTEDIKREAERLEDPVLRQVSRPGWKGEISF